MGLLSKKREVFLVVHREWKFFVVGLVAVVLASIWPGMRQANIGYVDPNIYIGYSENWKGLVEIAGYDYHATRLPFIALLKLLSLTGTYLFWLAYKFALNLIIFVGWILISSVLNVSRANKLISGLILLFHPIIFSSTSWTIAQSFAVSISVLVWGLLLNSYMAQPTRLISSAFAIVLCFNSNLWAGFLNLVGTLLYVLATTKGNRIKSFLHYNGTILVGAISLEFLWRLFFGWSQPLWDLHLRTVSRGVISQRGFEEWKSLVELIRIGQIPWTAISQVTVMIASFLLAVFNFKSAKQNTTIIFELAIASCAMSVASFASHLVGVNPQFTSFWYFYFNFTSWLLLFTAASHIIAKKSEIALGLVLKIVLYSELILAIMITDFSRPRISVITISFIGVCTLLFRYRVHFSSKILILTGATFLSMFFVFLSPSFASAYRTNNLKDAIGFYEDQKVIMKTVFNLPLNRGDLATWSEKDSSGFAGGELSTLSYHLTRLEGLGQQVEEIKPSMWLKNHDNLPKYIAIFLKSDSRYVINSKTLMHYEIESVRLLPSGKVKFIVVRLK